MCDEERLEWTEAGFLFKFGRMPEPGALDRLNCHQEGSFGHWNCGFCEKHDKPRFMCLCLEKRAEG